MKIKVIAIYIIIMWGFGFVGGYVFMQEKLEEQKYINNNLYHVIEDKDKAYYELEQMMIDYRWRYESCQTLFGDYQDKVEAGLYYE